MIIPNTHRLIIKPIKIDEIKSSGLVVAGQLTAGENLLYGLIVHPGDTDFEVDQGVFYSEYSAANLYNVVPMLSGKKSFGDIQKEGTVVVAADDVMAFYDSSEVPRASSKDRPKSES